MVRRPRFALLARELALPSFERHTVLAALGLLALSAFLFRRAVFLGEVFFDRDIHLYWFPMMADFIACIGHGALPTWEPREGFGQPFLSQPGAQLLYPPTWLNLLLLPGLYYTVFVVGHVAFSGVGTFLLARRLGLSPLGAFAAAAIWSASGPLVSMVNLWQHFAGAAWMPWVLVAANVSWRPRGSPVPLAAATAAQVLAGSADMCALTGILVACAGVVRLRTGGASVGRRLARRTLAGWALALAVTAAQWLPALELVANSTRAGLREDVRTHWSLPPAGLLQLILPVALSELPGPPELRSIENVEPFLGSLHLGLVAAGLVALGLSRGRTALPVVLLGVFVGAILLALGRHGPLYSLVVGLVPPLATFRYPVKVMAAASLAWALLAGLGLDAWGTRPQQRTKWVIAALVVIGWVLLGIGWGRGGIPGLTGEPGAGGAVAATLLAAFAFARARGLLRAERAAVWVVAIAIAELVFAHARVEPTLPASWLGVRPPTLDAISAGEAPVRIHVWDYRTRAPGQRYPERDLSGFFRQTPAALDPKVGRVLGLQAYLYPPVAARWGIHGSYTRDRLGLYRAWSRRLVDYMGQRLDSPEYTRLLRLGGVEYVLALHPEGHRELEVVARYPGYFAEDIRVMRVPGTLPRAYAVSGAREGDGGRALELMLADDFAPQREVVLAEGPVVAPRPGFEAEVRLKFLEGDRAVVECELSEPGYVVLLDTFDPGWRAWVDGEPAEVLRANLAFRAVRVPAGRHEVVFRYRPPGLLVGVLISLVSLLGLGLVLARSLLRAPASRASSGREDPGAP